MIIRRVRDRDVLRERFDDDRGLMLVVDDDGRVAGGALGYRRRSSWHKDLPGRVLDARRARSADFDVGVEVG